MFQTTVLDVLPLWSVYLISTVLIVIAVETGFYLGRRRRARFAAGETSHVGSAVAATLGLLAFMLAFTFGAGTDRWDTRKQLLLQETNALGTAFLRTELLPEPQRYNLQSLMSRYIDQYVDTMEEQVTSKGTALNSRLVRKLEDDFSLAKTFHGEMWREARLAAEKQPTVLTGLFISALNEAIDLRIERVSISTQQRMPLVFWTTVYFLAMLSLGLAGYDLGLSKGTHNLSGWVVALAFSSVITLVVALDRPLTSIVKQLPLLDLQAELHETLKQQK